MTAIQTRPGGMFLAVDRGARERPTVADFATVQPATAPLFEIAAMHDGQPPAAWLGYLKAQF